MPGLTLITVDYDRLGRLVTELRELGARLDSSLGASDLAGDPELASALAHVESDWRQHRRQLAGFLTGAAEAVAAGLAGYEQVDIAFANAASRSKPVG
jgi:hypothetical protein